MDKDKFLSFLKINILAIKYIPPSITVSKEELDDVLRHVLSQDDVDEQYIRDFITCTDIERNYHEMAIDKLMFVYQYGSKKAKKITVDEKLKFR
jgi:hypothetical protein